MLSGVKFLSKDEINKGRDEEKSDDSRREKRTSSKKKGKDRRKHKGRYSSSDDEEFEKIRKRSKKKWYSSDESSSSYLSEDESEDSFCSDEKKHKRNRKKKRKYDDVSEDEEDVRSVSKSTGRKKKHLPEEYPSDGFGNEKGDRSGRRKHRKSKYHEREEEDDDGNGESANDINIVRREMGLEWMLGPGAKVEKNVESTYEEQQEEHTIEEKVNPKELNPYLRNNGSGYPEEDNQKKTGQDELLSSSLVGDGGASWRLKALKRAKEQAEREGRKLDEVVEERWGSLGHLAVSVSSHTAAPSRAHLHAIRSRKMGQSEEHDSDLKNLNKDSGKRIDRDYLKDVSLGRPKMRAPKIDDSLSWRRNKGQKIASKDADLISSAVSSLNKFSDDGSFMSQFMNQQKNSSNAVGDAPSTACEDIADVEPDLRERRFSQDKQSLSANQLAAKAMQLRLKGQHEEAEKLLKEAENARGEEETGERLSRLRNQSSASRYVMRDIDVKQKQKEDDSDAHLAQRIMKNKQFSISGQADDEYDYDDGPSRKSRKRDARDEKRLVAKKNLAKHIVTQQERCQFCFENPSRPKHLVVAIANFTYLMLPQRQPVVPGHCCILPLQHESATRSVDDNVWEEIRNFKKCLIMMFAKQEKDVVFLETVMGLAQQRRHCLIECIPVPQEIAKQAPLYFKKAIDEAEEEWSQHNAKRLIDTSQKGLRASIPKNFPYFHVEFGLNRGFVHVIDDETQFKSSLGLNVIRGMLKLPEEDMYRRRRYETVEAHEQAVAAFAQDWEPFDWTKQFN